MTQADLVRAALAREATPRPPYGFWTHYPGIDRDPVAIARETVTFARATRQAFMKSMPNGLYAVEDWGVRADFSEIAAGGAAKVAARPIAAREDWARIKRLDPASGSLGRELRHLALLVEALGPEVPVLATVFSPVTTAKKVSGAAFARPAETHPALVRAALDTIAATTADFAERAIALGCAGVFFAVQDATGSAGEAAWRSLGLDHDLAALQGARGRLVQRGAHAWRRHRLRRARNLPGARAELACRRNPTRNRRIPRHLRQEACAGRAAPYADHAARHGGRFGRSRCRVVGRWRARRIALARRRDPTSG